ncbi:MAG: hypothetical protein MUW55_11215 [Pantoea vagans]|nr:hypothetical protein [Pantoea vagans]
MEQESQSTDSLYDFLYVDSDRASTLITQLYAPGVITSIKRISSEGEKSTKSGGISIPVANGKLSVEDAINQTQEKSFDASWSLPINLLDKLSELDLIKKGVENQKLGRIVLVRGKMRLFDISFFQKSLPFVSNLMLNELKGKPNARKTKPEDIELAPGMTFGLISHLLDVVPNTLQIDFMDDHGNNIWMTIDRENFTVNPDDLSLKYGGGIPGEWFVLGLIDALPDHLYDSAQDIDFPEHPMKDGFKGLLVGIQEFAGRPPYAYGMTPLILFRKID